MKRIALIIAIVLLLPLVAVATNGVNGEEPTSPPPEPPRRIVYLTIDDGPSAHTHAILDVLDEFGVPATFFFLGSNLQHHPGVVRRAHATGHGVHHHSWTHSVQRFYNSGPDAMMDEIHRTNDKFRGLTMSRSRLIRVPYGSAPWLNPNHRAGLRDALIENEIRFWDWNIDSDDWRQPRTAQSAADRIIPPLRVRSWETPANILIHEFDFSAALLRQILPVIINELNAEMRVITNTCAVQNFQDNIG